MQQRAKHLEFELRCPCGYLVVKLQQRKWRAIGVIHPPTHNVASGYLHLRFEVEAQRSCLNSLPHTQPSRRYSWRINHIEMGHTLLAVGGHLRQQSNRSRVVGETLRRRVQPRTVFSV